MHLPPRWPLLCGLAALLSFPGCRKEQTHAAPLPPVPVAVARVVTANVPTRVQAIGLAQPYSTVSVRTRVDGELQSVGFQQGDYVRKGQVLFTIDPRPFEAALSQADANLAKDLANYAEAKQEAARYAELAKAGVVSREQDDQMQAAAQALSASVAADRAAVETAKLNLSYCTIVSPVEGRTGSLLVQPGNVVQTNSTILVTINQIQPIYVAFAVPEQYLPLIKEFMRRRKLLVQVHPQNDDHLDTGALTFVDNAVDPTTGTIKLMGTFPNPAHRLWPGEYLSAEVTLAVAANAVVVPQAAVMTGQDNLYVYVVTPQGTVENRTVVAGNSVNGLTVIQKGLQPGETVVTDGQLRLFPGAKVRIMSGSPSSGPVSAGVPAAAPALTPTQSAEPRTAGPAARAGRAGMQGDAPAARPASEP
ncbi:MAG: efflux RND transporter periplasmic adaptor subunit [Terriglobales bacterium]